MSHALAYVQIPGDTNLEDFGAVEAAVAAAMEPYAEELDGDGAFWDWWQIGGRWYRHFDKDYDPAKDPELHETCRYCDGTGVRKDEVAVQQGTDKMVITTPDHPRFGQVGWCNGCDGTGVAQIWPTQWPRRVEGNVARRRDLSNDVPVTLVLDTGVEHREWWTEEPPSHIMQAEWNSLDPDALLVAVDYHS